VNFFAHYFCLPNQKSELLALGNLMPDIYPRFTGYYNSFLRSGNKFNQEIYKGIQFHLQADELFHQHLLFKENYEFAKKKLSKIEGLEKVYALAHVMVELAIDKNLLHSHKPNAELFYETLEKLTSNQLKLVVKMDAQYTQNQKFILNFKKFLSNKYLFRLEKNEGVREGLNQIFGNRLGMTLNAGLQADILAVIEEVDFRLKDNTLQHLLDIKKQIEL
jgi:hypothetical protein